MRASALATAGLGDAAAIAAAPAAARGEQFARLFFAVWEDPARRAPILALFRSAVTHESAAMLLRQFAKRVMVPLVAPQIQRYVDG